MKTSRAFIWYRDDLRLNDHRALKEAVEKHDEVIPVFVLPHRLLADGFCGRRRLGSFRAKFLTQSIEDLQQQIQAIGGGLLLAKGEPSEVFHSLKKQFECDTIYASRAYTPEEINDENKLEASGFNLQLYHTSTLIDPDELPFDLEKLPRVFTAFRKKVEKYGSFPEPIEPPEKLNTPHDLDSYNLAIEELFPEAEKVTIDSRSAFTGKGGASAALQHLTNYIWESEQISTYKETRNGLIGMDYSSKLSPWLANGSISPRTIFEMVKSFEKKRIKNQSTYWLVFELLWRDYFKLLAWRFGSKLFTARGIEEAPVDWKSNAKSFERWCLGETGVDFVDANMVELNKTGFMSNRGRQNVASFLTKDLSMDWRLGASYFESLLIDYDAASNYGNWQYVSGVGTDPRKDRKFNISLQADRYDPEKTFRRLWLTER